MKSWSAAILMGLFATTATSAATVKPACKQYDLMGAFWRVAEHGGAIDDFRKEVTSLHPEVYNADYVNALVKPQFTTMETNDIAWARTHRAQVDAVTAELHDHVADYMQRFGLAFDDFRCDFPFYIAPSFGHLDGSAATVHGKPMIVFAPDFIAQVHPPGSLKMLMDHETFHVYHQQASGGEFGALEVAVPRTYVSLWSEGLAVYASWQMNPDRNLDEALLDDGVRDVTASTVQAMARELLAHFDESDPALYARYFTGSAHPQGAPPRVGYYMGLLVARDLALQHSTKALAALHGEEARKAIRAALENLAEPGKMAGKTGN